MAGENLSLRKYRLNNTVMDSLNLPIDFLLANINNY